MTRDTQEFCVCVPVKSGEGAFPSTYLSIYLSRYKSVQRREGVLSRTHTHQEYAHHKNFVSLRLDGGALQ